MLSLDNLLKDFLAYLEIERNRSRRTINNYRFYIGRFCDFLLEQKLKVSISSLTNENVRQYRLWLNRQIDAKTKKTLKKNTQNYHLIALRAFLKYLTKRDISALAPEKIELSQLPPRQVEFLETNELERLLSAPMNIAPDESDSSGRLIQLRDRAILELLFSAGLRVSELTNLRRDSLDLNKDEFTVRGKGEKLRLVFLSNQAKYWLKKYLEKRRDTSLFLFVSHDKAGKSRRGQEGTEGLTPRSVQRLIKRYSKSVGIIKKITPHTMRHTYATDLLKNGADIRSVQAMLGHSSITTTQIYTHVTDKYLHEIYQKYHGKK